MRWLCSTCSGGTASRLCLPSRMGNPPRWPCSILIMKSCRVLSCNAPNPLCKGAIVPDYVHEELNRHFMKKGFVSAELHPSWFAMLEDPARVAAMNAVFTKHFGFKIIRTRNGRTWYPVYPQLDAHSRQE